MSSSQCKGCLKSYVNEIGLLQHFERSPLCKKWIDILDTGNSIANDLQLTYNNEGKCKTNNVASEFRCSSCSSKFSNFGNLNKHMKSRPICMKYHELNKEMQNCNEIIKPNETIEYSQIDENKQVNNSIYENVPPPSNSKLVHIIWNVLLTDKTQVKDLDLEIIDNNIEHIICILPSDKTKEIFQDIKPKKEMSCTIIEYTDHNPIITNDMIHLFENSYDKIEELQKIRKNTLIFCNSGYQRSLPFIIKYLVSRHPDEIPNFDKALDIVLSQVDKQNFNEIRDILKDNILMILKEDLTKFF